MPRTKISEFSATAASNTDIDSINIAENCPPSGINDAIRELMAQLKDFQTGAVGDSFNGPVGTTTAAAGAFTTLSSTGNTTLGDASGDSVTINGTATFANANPTLSAGTANGVAYLNGSKVVTSGSALVFDGSNLGLGVTPSASWATYNVLQIGEQGVISGFASGAGVLNTGANFYWDGSGYRYLTSNPASLYQQNAGGHNWRIASSGTAGNAITFTQAMTLDASGNLGVGTTSNRNSTKLDVFGDITFGGNASYYGTLAYNAGSGFVDLTSSDGGFRFIRRSGSAVSATIDSSGNLLVGTTSGSFTAGSRGNITVGGSSSAIYALQTGGTAKGYMFHDGTEMTIANEANGFLRFYTNATERVRIDSSGNLGIGTTSISYRLEAATGAGVYWNGSNGWTGGIPTAIVAKNTANGGYDPVFIGQMTDSAGNSKNSFAIGTVGTNSWTAGNNASQVASLYIAVRNDSGGISERVRIDSSGNLLVGATTAHNFGIPSIQAGGSNANAIISVRRDTTSSADQVLFYNPNGNVGGISTSGSATTYSTSSDYRLKNITGALTGYKERLMSLQPKQGTWITDGSEFRGFLAHEFAQPYRASVTGEKDAVNAEGKPIMQGMQASSSEVMADLVALVQEQQAIIESLKARLDAANL